MEAFWSYLPVTVRAGSEQHHLYNVNVTEVDQYVSLNIVLEEPVVAGVRGDILFSCDVEHNHGNDRKHGN
jgi:hypothetical protein